MDPSRATSFGSVSSKEHHLPKKQSSIHVHCSQPDAHSLQEHLGKQCKETLKQPTPTAQISTTKCHVAQLKGKDNPCSTLATQASYTKQSLSSTPPKPSTILDLCFQRVGYMFEGDILAVYGPAKYTNTQNKTEILHVDLIDCKGQMTVTMNISNTLVDTFLPRLTIGSGIRISNFTIKNKSQYERGVADCCIALIAKSTFETIPCVCIEHKLALDLTISQLSEADCHYSVGSFGEIGTSYHLTKTHLEVHIKDGDL
ncbi:uncharacterized protein LOC131061442 isoform X2 [Cryptomeria japonica]|uniref:uncharacterized protein LOC131061442 isoform X2 n=1 Tax=Cryptomeria japonica TaxID=3369 RepID=UPI0027DA4340|nr:uncharacterized protein LOC131061442 isoform X2 [Cryptomeria japonica]